jgi:hypothetical protein
MRAASILLLLGLGTLHHTERSLILAEHRIEMSLAARQPRTREPAAAIPSSRPEEIYQEKHQWLMRELAVKEKEE